jgi:hypothetical protein
MTAPPIGEPVDDAQPRRPAAGLIAPYRPPQATVTTPRAAAVIADRAAQHRIDPEVQKDRVIGSRLPVQDPVGDELGATIRARVDLVQDSDGLIHHSFAARLRRGTTVLPAIFGQNACGIDLRPRGIREADEEMT